jgi:hypothetical protein
LKGWERWNDERKDIIKIMKRRKVKKCTERESIGNGKKGMIKIDLPGEIIEELG